MNLWYREPTLEGNNTHLLSKSRVSEVVTVTKRPSCQIRRPVEKDEERLAMKKGDIPPTLPKRRDNPRMREDQALLEFFFELRQDTSRYL